VDKLVAFLPASTLNTEELLNIFLHEKVISWGHIVAEWWFVTLLTDVINVESWGEWVSKD